jgi:hypothetical protein
MSEMVERVATCIFEHFRDRYGQEAPPGIEECRLVARATIVAMREPTEGMHRAFISGPWDSDFRQCWADAIDEALKP